jgi:hypothetical protein
MEGREMKRTIMVVGLTLLLASAPAMAQMMGGGQQMMGGQGAQTPQQMMEQQQAQQTAPIGGQYYNQYMNPGMMGNYGYGMNPQMMGNYGYGMNPQMMGGGYGYGMGPGMMGGYSPQQYEKQYKEFQSFLDDTRDLRKKLHTLKFDFAEAQRNPDTKREDLEKMNTEMESLWKQIYEKKLPETK